eukprot:scaffold2657_cov368-Pavlova_lutheri.AAC.21
MEDQVARIKIDKGDIPILVQGNLNLWKGSVLLALEEAGVDDVLNGETPYDAMGVEDGKSGDVEKGQQGKKDAHST